MSVRNLAWLSVVVAVLVVVGVTVGWVWGIAAAVIVLIGSELYERGRRRRLRAARGDDPASPLRDMFVKRR